MTPAELAAIEARHAALVADTPRHWTLEQFAGQRAVDVGSLLAALHAEQEARARVEAAARRLVNAEDALADAHAAWPVHVGTYDEHLRVQHAAETELVTAKATLRAALASPSEEPGLDATACDVCMSFGHRQCDGCGACNERRRRAALRATPEPER